VGIAFKAHKAQHDGMNQKHVSEQRSIGRTSMMKWKLLARVSLGCALAVLSGRADAGILAGPIVNPANGHSYFLLSQNVWTGAEAEAVSLGGHLTTINDAAENTWVFNLFGNYGEVSRGLWIGLTDQAQEGTFSWTSGEVSAFVQWQLPNQPDSGSGLADEDYVHLLPPGHYSASYWNDFQNVSSVSFGDVPALGNVGMFGVVEVPEPTSGLIMAFAAPLSLLMGGRLLRRK